jgi:hypothetical protein
MLGCKQIQQKRRPIALHPLATRRVNLAFDGCGNLESGAFCARKLTV